MRSRSALIAIGINETGFREILGLMLGDSESETSRTEFFTWLKKHDLRRVDIVASDSHRGLVRAVRNQLQRTTWQHCQTHFMRNILDAQHPSLFKRRYIARSEPFSIFANCVFSPSGMCFFLQRYRRLTLIPRSPRYLFNCFVARITQLNRILFKLVVISVSGF